MSLNNKEIPVLAFGTFPLTGETAINSVSMALELGYRHIDTAQMYENETEVGLAISSSGLPRSEVFITTKINPPNHSEDQFLDSARRSCDDLQVDSVDLLLLHWPPLDQPLEPVLDLLDSAAEAGLAKRIGVSNFTISQLSLACAHLQHPVFVNQVEFHPFLDQSQLLKAATQKNVQLMAYASLARGRIASDPTIVAIANQLERTPGEVTLRWIIQQGVIATVMSTNRQRAEANKRCLDFVLGEDDMEQITELTQKKLRLVSPAGLAPEWDS